MRFSFCHSYTLQNDKFRQYYKLEQQRTQWKIAMYFRPCLQHFGGSGSGKANALLKLLNEQDDSDKICFYPKDLSEHKYEFFIKKCA